MDVSILSEKQLPSFLDYCRKHKYEQDDSFLTEQDLDDFKIAYENPTWLLHEGEEIKGALSLICDDYYLKGQRARARIFHCETGEENHYRSLLRAAVPLNYPIEKIEMFLPDGKSAARKIIGNLGFSRYRTSYLMIRKDKNNTQPSFPQGYTLNQINLLSDADLYREIRNRAFRNLKGSETPISRNDVIKHYNDKSLLEGGMAILRDGKRGVGILRVSREEEERGCFSFIGPLALIPEYQGRGLGRELLKAGIAIGREQGLADCMLVVNGENEMALRLYRGTGFEIDMSVSCYTYPNRALKNTPQPKR